MDRLLARALRAYFVTAGPERPDAQQSGIEGVAGRRYVVLRSDARVLAIYRVRNDGMLKRLKRWPLKLIRRAPSCGTNHVPSCSSTETNGMQSAETITA